MSQPDAPNAPVHTPGSAASPAPAGASTGAGAAAPAAAATPADGASAARPALPDRLSVDPRSPHHVRAVFAHDIGIRLNGKERLDVEEYCVSGGWVKVPANKTLDRKGRPLLIQLKGQVEAYYKS